MMAPSDGPAPDAVRTPQNVDLASPPVAADAPVGAHCAIEIRPAASGDVPGIAALHAGVFGPGRFARTAFRVREGTPDVTPLCRVADRAGELIGSVRMTAITLDGVAGFQLLGPICVAPRAQRQAIGAGLVRAACDAAACAGCRAVLLVGDPPFYERLGAQSVPGGAVRLPGPVDPARLVAFVLTGAVEDVRGTVAPAPGVSG